MEVQLEKEVQSLLRQKRELNFQLRELHVKERGISGFRGRGRGGKGREQGGRLIREREWNDNEPGAKRRQVEEPKRLSSVIVTQETDSRPDRNPERRHEELPLTVEAEAPVVKPQIAVPEPVKKRNRNLFGALVGHLQKAKDRLEGNRDRELIQRQEDAKQKATSRLEQEAEEAKAQRRREFEEAKQRSLTERLKVESLLAEKELALQIAKIESRYHHVSNFIRSKATPSLCYLPKVLTEASQRLLEDTQKAIMDEKNAKIEAAKELSRQRAERFAVARVVANEGEEEDMDEEDNQVPDSAHPNVIVTTEEGGDQPSLETQAHTRRSRRRGEDRDDEEEEEEEEDE